MTFGKRIMWELRIILVCAVLALGVNAYAIAHYKTQWSELYTTWNVTLAIAFLLYAFVCAVRFVIACARWFFFQKKW